MIFKRTQEDESLRMLRRANPRSQPGFDQMVEEHQGIRDEVLNQEAGPAPVSPGYSRRGLGKRSAASRRTLGLSAAGVVVAAAVLVAVLTVGGDDNPLVTPAYAAEAVKKAAVDTSAAAQSGTIDTDLVIGGEAQVQTTFSWNGSDLSLVNRRNSNAEIRYVGGLYYETYGYSIPVAIGDTEHAGQWLHCTDYDNGARPAGADLSAMELPNPSEWLAAARTDLAGTGLVALIENAGVYRQLDQSDGSVTYAGTTTVATVQALDWGLSGLPMASQPSFKVRDPNTLVALRVKVSADGLIQQLALEWTLDEPGESSQWSYTATYRDLGSAKPILAPDPSHTVTTDNRFPDSMDGGM